MIKLLLKIACTSNQLSLNITSDLLTQRDQLVGIILGDDGLEHLVGDWRQHDLLIVDAELLIDLGQFRGDGSYYFKFKKIYLNI